VTDTTTDIAVASLRWLLEHVTGVQLLVERTCLLAVLAERDALAAEAVGLRAVRDSRVREVRAAHAAGWLDHAEFVAERNRAGFDARETAGQAYAATRIADWHETGPEATDG
jgi:hypothetical protein